MLNRVIVLALTLAAGPSARADERLAHAVQLFGAADDEQASRLLRVVLSGKPSAHDAAYAHLYLGLIALNAIDPELGRREFMQALRLNPLLELPRGVSPKARPIFEDAQRTRLAEGIELSPVEGPQATPPMVASVGHDTEGPSYLPSLLTLGLGVAALGTGLALGGVSLSSHNAAPGAGDALTMYNEAQAAASNGRAADVLFGVATAAAICGGILLTLELLSKPDAAPAHSPER